MNKIYNIKTIIILICFIISMSAAKAQTWDYIANTGGGWKAWSDATAWTDGGAGGYGGVGTIPSATSKVQIPAGQNIYDNSSLASWGNLQIDGTFHVSNWNGMSGDNLTISATGALQPENWYGNVFNIYLGVHTATPVLHVDGLLGNAGGGNTASIQIVPKTTVSTLTIEGSGTIAINGISPEGADDATTAADMNININANLDLKGTVNWLSSLSVQSGSKFINNRILTIAAGKKVTIAGIGVFHNVSAGATATTPSWQTQGNSTYNILGTLDFTCADASNNFDLATPGANWISSSVKIDIQNGGKLRFGGNGSNVCNIGFYTNSANYNSQTSKIISETGSAIEFYGNASPVITTGYGTGGGTTLPTFPTTIDNLIMNNSAGVSLPNDITIGTSLALTQGVLNTNSHALTLASTASGTAYIPAIGTGSITGNITVQRYLSNNNTWRGIGVPLSSGLTAAPAYTYIYNETADDQTNYGSNNTTPNAGWATYSGNLSSSKGYLIYSTAAQTLSNTGTINTGTQGLTVSKSKAGWNFLANPLPCGVSWTSIAANNTGVLVAATAAVYRVNPSGTGGVYQFSSFIPGTGGTNGGSDVIENGAAFFIQAAAAGTLNIGESDKTTNAVGTTPGGLTLFGTEGNSNVNVDNGSIKLSLAGEVNKTPDEVILKWSSAGTDNFNAKYDALDLGTYKMHDLAIVGSDNIRYSIFNGSALKSSNEESRSVTLGLKSLSEGSYQINTHLLTDLSNGNKAYLVDNYLHQIVGIDNSNPVYKFTVTADTLTKADGRFKVELNYKETTNANTSGNFSIYGNITTGNSFVLHSNTDVEKLEWKLVDASGNVLQTGILNNLTKESNTTVNTKTSAAGLYFIQLQTGNNQEQTLKLVK